MNAFSPKPRKRENSNFLDATHLDSSTGYESSSVGSKHHNGGAESALFCIL